MTDRRKFNGGARPNAGRPRRAQELELHGLMAEAWPIEKRRAAIENMAEIAQGSSKTAVSAFQILAAYAYGKPLDRKEISGPDGEPLKAYVSVSPAEWDTAPEETD